MDSPSDRQAERNAARRRIARITQATAGAAALGTCVVAGLAATTPTHATSGTAQTAVASETTDPAVVLTPADSSPETTGDAPVATSGGS